MKSLAQQRFWDAGESALSCHTAEKGEAFEDRDKVQILGAMELPNGDVKNELFTLSVENYRDFSDFLNQKISIAVGAMAMGRNVVFYVAKGAQPELAKTV